jgi:hypothetical protein
MSTAGVGTRWAVRALIGVAAGLAIAFVDNYWSGGEVSPIVIVALLLLATLAAGAIWGVGGWVSALATWACVPLAHVVKHVAGVPDTLHPNTYVSILLLAAFCLIVGAAGFGFGVLLHRGTRTPSV